MAKPPIDFTPLQHLQRFACDLIPDSRISWLSPTMYIYIPVYIIYAIIHMYISDLYMRIVWQVNLFPKNEPSCPTPAPTPKSANQNRSKTSRTIHTFQYYQISNHIKSKLISEKDCEQHTGPLLNSIGL